MLATRVLVLRHAEKPGMFNGVAHSGTDAFGNPDPESLTSVGWQRAGALAALLAPQTKPFAHPLLAKPDFLFASRPFVSGPDVKVSKRPFQTISPLTQKLGLSVDTSFEKTDHARMVAAALSLEGVVLISWQHELIPLIAKEILVGTGTSSLVVPETWPKPRYDVIWVFDRPAGDGPFASFTQVPQCLLFGDLSEVIPLESTSESVNQTEPAGP